MKKHLISKAISKWSSLRVHDPIQISEYVGRNNIVQSISKKYQLQFNESSKV